MKKLTFALIVVLLSGCSMIAPKYDNNEYKLLVSLEVDSRLLVKDCSDPQLVQHRLKHMVNTSELFFTYTFYIPHNDDTYEMAKILRTNINELKERYSQESPPSKFYCGIKSKILIESTQRALEAVGSKVE